jgi:hypothetical protein
MDTYVICSVLCSVCWQQCCLVILKLAIFVRQTERTPKHFFLEKKITDDDDDFNSSDASQLHRLPIEALYF